jgi:hypothetical protein
MCPTCIANVAVMVFGLTSTSGLTAFMWKQSMTREENTEQQNKNLPDQKEENHG